MKKILFVVPSLGSGGAEKQMAYLAKELVPMGYVVHVAALNREPDRYSDFLKDAGVKCNFFSRKSKFDFSPILKLNQYIKNEKIDVVHSFLVFGSLFAAVAAKFSGVPLVASAIRDADNSSRLGDFFLAIVDKLADYLVSNSLAGFTARYSKIKKHHIVIRNGICISNDGKERNDEYEKTFFDQRRLDKNNFLVGMVARLTIQKDHYCLLNAAKIVIAKYPQIKFLLIGEGELHHELEELAKKLGIQDNVIFLGYRADVAQIVELLDISILLSNHHVHAEGCPNAVIESMWLGTPVIASYGEGTAEVLKNEDTGLIVESGNVEAVASAIIRLYDDAPFRELLAENARVFAVDNFSFSRQANDYIKLYENLI